MDIKLDNGTVFSIESNNNSISVQKKYSNNETTEIFTRKGCKLTLDDNFFYVV